MSTVTLSTPATDPVDGMRVPAPPLHIPVRDAHLGDSIRWVRAAGPGSMGRPRVVAHDGAVRLSELTSQADGAPKVGDVVLSYTGGAPSFFVREPLGWLRATPEVAVASLALGERNLSIHRFVGRLVPSPLIDDAQTHLGLKQWNPEWFVRG